jgi:hypothetical protein
MLLLLPGFLALGLATYVANLREYSDFELGAYSLALSLVIFALASFLYRLPHAVARIFRKKRQAQPEVALIPPPSLPFIGLVLLISISMGLVIAYLYESDTVLKLLRESPGTGMTTKRSSARPMVFLFSLNRKGQLEDGRPAPLKVQEAWVRITLAGDRSYSGYPEFFPFGEEESEIFLSPACMDGETVSRHPGPGVLIREENIESIEFLDRGSSDCYREWAKIQQAREPTAEQSTH